MLVLVPYCTSIGVAAADSHYENFMKPPDMAQVRGDSLRRFIPFYIAMIDSLCGRDARGSGAHTLCVSRSSCAAGLRRGAASRRPSELASEPRGAHVAAFRVQ